MIKCKSKLILKFMKKKINLNAVKLLKLQMHLAFIVLKGNYLLNYFEIKFNLFYKKKVGACSLVINSTMPNPGEASSNSSFSIL